MPTTESDQKLCAMIANLDIMRLSRLVGIFDEPFDLEVSMILTQHLAFCDSPTCDKKNEELEEKLHKEFQKYWDGLSAEEKHREDLRLEAMRRELVAQGVFSNQDSVNES